MTGRSTVIAQIEMYRLAKENTPKVRRELVRLGCQGTISVKQEDMNIRLNYLGRSSIFQPQTLLAILEQLKEDKSPEDVWELITGEYRDRTDSAMKKLSILVLILMLAAFTAAFLSQQ